MAVSETILDHVYRTLKDLKDGRVRPAAQALAAHYGVAEGTIYRYAGLRGLRWRKEKATKGASRVSRDALVKASALLLASRRSKGHIIMPGRDAKEILEDSGIDTGGVSTSWFLARMRQENISGRDLARPSPHTELLSDHPNHVWQFDVTNCVQYFLTPEKGMGERDTELELSKNKIVKTAKTIRRELLRYAVVDHCSGALYFRYFYSSGERAIDGAQFLYEAMRPKTDLFPEAEGKYPFQGVPFILVTDKGSIATAKANHALFEALRMELITHLPGNPRGKGQVENAHNIVERKFEGRLKFMRIRDVDHLNAEAHVWMREFNGARVHSRHGHTRYGLWQKIRAEQLRLAPPRALCEQLLTTKPEPRTVTGSLMISYRVKGFDPADYSLRHIDEVRVGETVEVCVNPYRAPNIDVIVKRTDGTQTTYECAPIARNEAGFWAGAPVIGREYQGAPDTLTDRHRKEMAKQAFGVETQREVDAKRKDRTPAFDGIDPVSYLKDQTHAHYMPRRGQHLPVEVPRNTPALITPTQALIRLARTLGRPLLPEEHESFTRAYPQGLTDEDLQAWLTQRPDEHQATG